MTAPTAKEISALEDRSLTKGGQVMTFSGRLIDPFALEPDDVDLSDIIWGLSHTYRYGGQADPGITVAEHSMLVAQVLNDPVWAPYALLHDACEAYLGDVPAPLKRSLRIERGDLWWSFEEAERRVLVSVARRFDLDPILIQDTTILKADLIVRDIERSAMENMRWNEPVIPPGYEDFRPYFHDPSTARDLFRRSLMEAGISMTQKKREAPF